MKKHAAQKWIWFFVTAGMIGFLVVLNGLPARQSAPDTAAVPVLPSPEERLVPTPIPTQMAEPEPTEPTEPVETLKPAQEPAEAARDWTLSFAGDCTIGTLHEWQGNRNRSNMLSVMGNDCTYPFSGVLAYFEADDLTLVNLEGAFTERTEAKEKDYRFRAPGSYASALSEGGIEAVTLANNHSGDYLAAGIADTKAALEAVGVLWTDAAAPAITELEDGLKLGIISFNTVEIDVPVGDVDTYLQRVTADYEYCAAEGCDLILAYIHWGWEYRTAPETWMVAFAHRLAELGCDMVIGSHAHVLQPTEIYEGVPIFYSLGNFCFGGHSNPADKDTIIVRQTVHRNEDGTVTLGDTAFIPCRISSTDETNDFHPTPYEENSEDWQRVLGKLQMPE